MRTPRRLVIFDAGAWVEGLPRYMNHTQLAELHVIIEEVMQSQIASEPLDRPRPARSSRSSLRQWLSRGSPRRAPAENASRGSR